jgi:hypothetical protein
MRIYAFGKDPYWLVALKKATANSTIELVCNLCEGCILESVEKLSLADKESIILLDVYGQTDIWKTVRTLRMLGWRFIIVVAADRSEKAAIKILHDELGFDYWEKTYDAQETRLNIEQCLGEIENIRA